MVLDFGYGFVIMDMVKWRHVASSVTDWMGVNEFVLIAKKKNILRANVIKKKLFKDQRRNWLIL